jgi:hypothetical protein
MQSALQKNARRLLILSLVGNTVLLSQICATKTWAAPIGYSFTGTVTFSSPTTHPYGIVVPSSSTFSGYFYFDPNTAPVNAGTSNDSSFFPQLISGGFSATISKNNVTSMTISADSYAIEIQNNLPRSNSTVDEFSIVYSSGITAAPPLDPIIVNGEPYTHGDFEIDLVGSSSLYSSSSLLPTNINLSDFPTRTVVINDQPPQSAVEVLCSITSLTAIPMVKGDLNRDGKVDDSDVEIMMQMLSDPTTYETTHDLTGNDLLALGDLNNSNSIDIADLQSLLTLLKSGGISATAVPEPSSISLLSITGYLMIALARRHNKIASFD